MILAAVAGERRHRACDLIKQGADFGTVVDLLGRERGGDDLAALSTSRCMGSPFRRVRGRDASSVAARRLMVLWSGTRSSSPSRPMTEPIRPSVWRSARRNTALSVRAVRMASGK